MKLSGNLFFYILIILTVLSIGSSYLRFMVNHDYIVEYEGECNPDTQSCFIGCEDEECSEEYYYSIIAKYAPDLMRQCGTDITDCEKASICLPDETETCSFTYCDVDIPDNECFSKSKKTVSDIDNESKSIDQESLNDGVNIEKI